MFMPINIKNLLYCDKIEINCVKSKNKWNPIMIYHSLITTIMAVDIYLQTNKP